jgi:hypothetical protein
MNYMQIWGSWICPFINRHEYSMLLSLHRQASRQLHGTINIALFYIASRLRLSFYRQKCVLRSLSCLLAHLTKNVERVVHRSKTRCLDLPHARGMRIAPQEWDEIVLVWWCKGLVVVFSAVSGAPNYGVLTFQAACIITSLHYIWVHRLSSAQQGVPILQDSDQALL